MKTFRTLGIAASLMVGAALTASAAVTTDNQGDTTTPTAAINGGTGTQYSNGASMAPGYTGGPTGPNSNAATTTPKVDRGNAEGAAGGTGGGGGSGH